MADGGRQIPGLTPRARYINAFPERQHSTLSLPHHTASHPTEDATIRYLFGDDDQLQGSCRPTEESRKPVQGLIYAFDQPWKNDELSHVYLGTNLNIREAAEPLGTSTCVLSAKAESIRIRNEYRDLDTGTE